MKRLFVIILLITNILLNTEAVKIVAHRGCWKAKMVPKNSLLSLKESAKSGVFGSEFDVHYTADGVGIVYHDDSLMNKPICSLRYNEIKSCALSNGDLIPTLKGYLREAQRHPQLTLFLEIKSDYTPSRDRELARLTLRDIKKWGKRIKIQVITFSRDAATELIRLNPNINVNYLDGGVSLRTLAQLGFAGIDFHYSDYQANPNLVDSARFYHLKTNVWTVNDSTLMQEMIQKHVDFITTDEPQLLQRILSAQH